MPTKPVFFKYFDPNYSYASDPLRVSISTKKVKFLFPRLFHFFGLFGRKKIVDDSETDYLQYYEELLWEGDSQPAIVISLNPCRIACYTDEFDGVIMLEYSKSIKDFYKLEVGTKLISVNGYGDDGDICKDIVTGEKNYKRYTAITPFIADFLSDDTSIIEKRKSEIQNDFWHKLFSLGKLIHKNFPELSRFVKKNGCVYQFMETQNISFLEESNSLKLFKNGDEIDNTSF